MQQQMNDMEQKLDQLSGQLDALSTQINQISAEIKQANYDDRVSQMTALITNIITIKAKMIAFEKNPSSDPQVVNKDRAAIMALIEKQLIGNEEVIHSQQVGIAFVTPLLKLWSQVVKSQHRFLTPADSATVQAQFNYFNELELWLAEELMEYYHSQATSFATDSQMYKSYCQDAQNVIQQYNADLASEQALELQSIPAGMLWDQNQDLLIQNTPWEWGNPDWLVPVPSTLSGQYFGVWGPASREQVFSIFNESSGSSPYKYALS